MIMRLVAQGASNPAAAVWPFIGTVIGGMLTFLGTWYSQRTQRATESSKADQERATQLLEKRREVYARYWEKYTEYVGQLNDWLSRDPDNQEEARRGVIEARSSWNQARWETILLAGREVGRQLKSHLDLIDKRAQFPAEWQALGVEDHKRLDDAEFALLRAMRFEVADSTDVG